MTTIPQTMTAAVVRSGQASMQEIAVPTPTASQVLVKVFACSVNRADLSVAAGHKHGSVGGDGTVIGMEWAGEVVATGADVPETIVAGQRVMCSGTAGDAEYAVCDHGRVFAMPDSMDYATATTLPIGLMTMYEAIVMSGAFVAGQSVLIQGASSGVGLMGLQIAKALGARVVIGTSTDAGRRARLGEFGADLALDSNTPDWSAQVIEATAGGVDLIVDMVSGKTVNQSLAATRIRGRIVNVGRLGGTEECFDFDLHAMRRVQYIGTTFRTRSVEEVREIAVGVRQDLVKLVRSGTLRLPIDRIFKLEETADALAYVKSNSHFGKVVLVSRAGNS
jgi:NADPH2:quinone reductase